MPNPFYGCMPSEAAAQYTGRTYGDRPMNGRKAGPARAYSDELIFSAVCAHLDGATNKQICERYGISHGALSHVLLGRSYRDVVKKVKLLYLERELQTQHEAMDAQDNE